ncbi:LOW QUALITY PROTEIN: reverse transcriptase [Phytophthora megakarya]|uniref:Reverse transcriptase n=1 Tax=Phytophthora megakarya TaxID=4795 RepID=A0A225VY38_9STRA|nr:LOW QUALITY PROTEIN: reverse transcriptase [Phytophthora megakarya]
MPKVEYLGHKYGSNKSNELNYGIAEKEVLALLRILDLNYNALVGRPIHVLTRHSTLAWPFISKALQGRLDQWAAPLSPWTLEIIKCVKGKDEIKEEDESLGALAARITPRSQVDKALISIAPKKEPRRKIQAPIPTIRRDEKIYVRGGGAYSAILWKLPEWRVLKATSGYAEGLTVNEAEYHGLLLCLDMLEDLDPRRLVIRGDTNLVIRQVRGVIDCKAPGLTLLRQQALDRLRTWPDPELLHVKRDWNGSADSLASAALQRQCGIQVESEKEIQDLVTLNRLDEILIVKIEDEIAQISAVTTRSKARSGVRIGSDPDSLREEVNWRIRQAQDEESWILGLKKYLVGEIRDLTQEDARVFGSIAMNYEVDQSDLPFYCPTTKEAAADRDKLMRLVIPEALQQDILHHYHTSLQGGHQGIGRTYDRIRDRFHWRGLYKSVQRYVGEYVDCETVKGRPRIQGESPGNLQATCPFQIIAMDHIPSLPKSFNGNTELLIFVDLFSGYVIAKASASRSAQTIAETYEECVFRRFGASEVIRHDREPGFMSDFFKSFNKILGQRQRTTMAYRTQANGSAGAECMVQTVTRALKMYVQDLDQRDWDEHAERLTFAINTARDRIQGETPFYMIHGWDPRSTLKAMIPVGSTRRHDRDLRRWRYRMQKYYRQAREQVNQRLREAIADRADTHNDLVHPHLVEAGSKVWLYLDRVQYLDRVREGYAKKLAHLWHGPFRVAEKIGEYAVRIKLVKIFRDRSVARLEEPDIDRVDFDEALLPEDSWIQDRGPDEYEMDRISDMRTGKKTRYGRIYRGILVHWRGYEESTWVDEADLNCWMKQISIAALFVMSSCKVALIATGLV